MDLRHEVLTTGCRRLWVLIRGLPVDSAVHREGRQWSQADELSAVAIERADVWGHRLAIASRAFKKVPEMPRVDHPDRPVPRAPERAQVRASTPQEIGSFIRSLGGEVRSA